MSAFASQIVANPLDRVERLAEMREWNIARTHDDEVVMAIDGNTADLNLSITWRGDIEALLLAGLMDVKVPQKRRKEVSRLIALINARLICGHFDLWLHDGSIVFRNMLLLAGAEASDGQCEAIVRIGIETCNRYYPAIQFVIWAGYSAEQALECALLETMGEA